MEIQDEEPAIKIPLERIGFKNVRRRIVLNTPEGRIALDVELDLLVSISGDRRGAHLSRNIEALDLEEVLRDEEPRSLEEYLQGVVERLLDLHGYAIRAEAIARTTYYVRLRYNQLIGEEPVDVEIKVSKNRDKLKSWTTTVTMAGMSVCPSAQSTIKEILNTESITPSHVQRVYLTGKVTTNGELVRIEDIAEALAKSFSAPALTFLKRYDEAKLVIAAHNSPKFAEDIVRSALVNIAEKIKNKIKSDALIEAEVESLESIHPHNVYAYARESLSSILSSPNGIST